MRALHWPWARRIAQHRRPAESKPSGSSRDFLQRIAWCEACRGIPRGLLGRGGSADDAAKTEPPVAIHVILSKGCRKSQIAEPSLERPSPERGAPGPAGIAPPRPSEPACAIKCILATE